MAPNHENRNWYSREWALEKCLQNACVERTPLVRCCMTEHRNGRSGNSRSQLVGDWISFTPCSNVRRMISCTFPGSELYFSSSSFCRDGISQLYCFWTILASLYFVHPKSACLTIMIQSKTEKGKHEWNISLFFGPWTATSCIVGVKFEIYAKNPTRNQGLGSEI